MAYISFQPKDYFNTKLWTGTGAENAITGVGFQPDWVWIKNRDAAEHNKLYDAVRGANKVIYSNLTNAEATVTQDVKSFDSDGFTLGTESAVNASGQDIVGWNWRANGAGVSNTDGSITSTVSASSTSGFSIVKYTGTGANATVGTGLGVAPSIVLCKNLSASGNWIMYHSALGATKYMVLNATDAVATATAAWNDTAPTSSVFSVGTGSTVNGSGNNLIAYCFAPVKGFSAMGSYVGNGSADGSFIYTGFKPAFVLLKNTTLSVENWVINDSGRNPSNIVDKDLFANQNYVEAVHSRQDFLSNGFKFRSTANNSNKSGDTYIYMAFAEHPLISSNGVPATAR